MNKINLFHTKKIILYNIIVPGSILQEGVANLKEGVTKPRLNHSRTGGEQGVRVSKSSIKKEFRERERQRLAVDRQTKRQIETECCQPEGRGYQS